MADIIPLCESEPSDGFEPILGSILNVTLRQTIPTVFTGGFLYRTCAWVQILNNQNFVINDLAIVSANLEGLNLYNDFEDLMGSPLRLRPIIGGPNFNTDIGFSGPPYYSIPEGGKLIVKGYGSFHRKISWLTVAGYEVSLDYKEPGVPNDRMDSYIYSIVGSGLYGCRNEYTHSYARNFYTAPAPNDHISGWDGFYHSYQPTCVVPKTAPPKFYSWIWDRWGYLTIPDITGWNLYVVKGGNEFKINPEPMTPQRFFTGHLEFKDVIDGNNLNNFEGSYMKALINGVESDEKYPNEYGFYDMTIRLRQAFWWWGRRWDVIVSP